MRIYYTPGDDPMLRDTPVGLANLNAGIQRLVDSSLEHAAFDAVSVGSPAPYQELLLGLRVLKGEEARLSLSRDRWLELQGSAELIAKFAGVLVPNGSFGHRHWYSVPMSLIIEPVDEYEI